MADISIDDLRKVMIRPDVSARARTNDIRKAQSFLSDPNIRIVEKIDGTKLTLIRRNNEFDPENYRKNWYIAYKGELIMPGEVANLGSREEEVRSGSSGFAQYSLIHSHMARVHQNTSKIPQGTEFFIEFVQRKPTISRDYPKKHGLFLTMFGPSRYKVTGTNLVSDMDPVDDDSTLETYADLLDLQTYPVLFEGSLLSLDGLKSGIKSSSIGKRFSEMHDELRQAYSDTSQDKPLRVVDAIYKLFSDFETTLSTESERSPAEGSVFKTSATKSLYKALRFDQHDVAHRQDIKQKFKSQDPAEEERYWNEIVSIAEEISTEVVPSQKRNVTESELDETLQAAHQECYFDSAISNRLGALRHPKTLIQRQEDLYTNVKSQIMKRLQLGDQTGISLGIFIVAGKPIHAGHWEMIKKASSECDEALILTSASGRDEIKPGDMIDSWKAILEPQFHKDFSNATLIMTSDSPVQVAIGKMRQLKHVVDKFVFYSDDVDAAGKYEITKLRGMVKDPAMIEKLQQRAIPRSETVQVSGTDMRGFLIKDDKASFDKFCPPTLAQEMKDKYWSILKGAHGPIKDSRIRSILRMMLEIKNISG
jgi:hypothetical protein